MRRYMLLDLGRVPGSTTNTSTSRSTMRACTVASEQQFDSWDALADFVASPAAGKRTLVARPGRVLRARLPTDAIGHAQTTRDWDDGDRTGRGRQIQRCRCPRPDDRRSARRAYRAVEPHHVAQSRRLEGADGRGRTASLPHAAASASRPEWHASHRSRGGGAARTSAISRRSRSRGPRSPTPAWPRWRGASCSRVSILAGTVTGDGAMKALAGKTSAAQLLQRKRSDRRGNCPASRIPGVQVVAGRRSAGGIARHGRRSELPHAPGAHHRPRARGPGGARRTVRAQHLGHQPGDHGGGARSARPAPASWQARR